MATLALYNKWRGQTFADILGQEHITTTLQNQIRAGRIGHAYLFTGLRGTGKTSTARILAKAINCVGGVDEPPCNRCHICVSLTEGRSLDLVEIDGASNRGVDEIRDLRERVNFSPSECRYKVYVIDEVHMLTREAFNALLKTLEEPPAHVVFIMCTTEPHRLPDTVLSRCQRFDFRRGALDTILAKLRTICEREGLAVQPEALEFIARRATGSFRDAESLLDQLSAYGTTEITLEQVQGLLGTASSALVADIVRALLTGDVPSGLRAISQALDGGAEPRQFVADLLEYLRALMLLTVGGAAELDTLGPEVVEDLRGLTALPGYSLGLVVRAIRLFNEATQGLRYAVRPELPLELALVEAALPAEAAALPAQPAAAATAPAPAASGAAAAPSGPAPRAEPVAAPAEAPPAASPVAEQPAREAPPTPQAHRSRAPRRAPVVQEASPAPAEEPTPAEPERAEPAPAVDRPADVPALTLDWVRGHWQKVLIHVRSNSRQVEALLKSAEPIEVYGTTVVLGCEAEFHSSKLSEDKRRLVVEQALSAVLGVACTVTCSVARGAGLSRNGPGQEPPGDIFEAGSPRKAAEERLLNHPAVVELTRQGGRVTRVRVNDADNTEEDRGQ
ncbi:MAG: DNA polymerase III subunit gamma/tau [Chloroflexi bacterium]|nr:DNA polymerase III subunit gamma/tau [Chloroflexota bacterium]